MAFYSGESIDWLSMFTESFDYTVTLGSPLSEPGSGWATPY